MNTRELVRIAIVMLAAGGAGCANEESSSERVGRASQAIEACNAHEGVTAFEDDVVICGDGTSNGERGTRAVQACRGHGGVSAFDDDIAICTDQTFQRVEGG